MKKPVTFLIILFTGFSLFAQTVKIQSGEIQGQMNGSVYEFLGIPFASPPIDNLRWKAPVEHVQWEGILITTAFAPVCPQKRFEQGDTTAIVEGDEDCLYLNVWTPDLNSVDLPVLVFIHGGGNQQGGASQTAGGTEMYNGKNMAERGNAVIVTIQYRLGPLGFLVHPGLEAENENGVSGNYALLDQILALKWIQNNIFEFGGNPQNVTIFGESAGGVDVGDLLFSPLAEGLFHRAIIQSAVPVIDVYNNSKSYGIDFVNQFESSGSDIEKIAKMRIIPADSLVQNLESPLQGGIVQSEWHPVIDNYIFPGSPLDLMQSGNYNKVPVIIGSNEDEMNLSAPAVVTPAMVNALVFLFIPAQKRAEVLSLYPPGTTNEQARKSYVGILSDLQFTSPVRRVAQCLSRNQSEPVWNYYFTYKHSLPQLEKYGSYHGMELLYVFNNWENTLLGGDLFFKPADDSLQNVLRNYWVNFARTGNPNGGALENWPQFSGDELCYLEIKATPNGSKCRLKTAELNLWDDVVGFIGCSQSVGISENKVENNPLTVFPNPTKGIVECRFSGSEIGEITVFNSTGQKVKVPMYKNYIDLSDQTQGIYVIQLKTNKEIFTQKVMKQN